MVGGIRLLYCPAQLFSELIRFSVFSNVIVAYRQLLPQLEFATERDGLAVETTEHIHSDSPVRSSLISNLT